MTRENQVGLPWVEAILRDSAAQATASDPALDLRALWQLSHLAGLYLKYVASANDGRRVVAQRQLHELLSIARGHVTKELSARHKTKMDALYVKAEAAEKAAKGRTEKQAARDEANAAYKKFIASEQRARDKLFAAHGIPAL
jgi:hypothetical protein